MKVLSGDWRAWEAGPPLAVAVGVFDGVHRGHQTLLGGFCAEAASRGLIPAVVTFDRHPLAVLAPDRAPHMLSSVDDRIEQLGEIGVEIVAVLTFDDRVRAMTPEAFVSEILVGALGAALVVVGEDFRFGRERSGDVHLLGRLGEASGFDVQVVELVGGDLPVSSTRIRSLLAAGSVGEAASLLGRRYRLTGEVVPGSGGSLVTGVPTANIDVPTGMAIPGRGVYAVLAGVDELVPAVANVGVRPTFGTGVETIEVHLLDRDDDLMGRRLAVEFVERLRSEEEFVDGDELSRQIGLDLDHAREVLARHTP